MKNILSAVIITTTLFIAACSNPEKEADKKLAEEVTALHDVVMPNMDEIQAVQRELKEAVAKDPNLKAAADSLNRQLNAADEAMMQWMQNYNPNYYSENEGHSHEQIVKYYEAERKKIQEVQEQMKASIDAAKNLLKNKQ